MYLYALVIVLFVNFPSTNGQFDEEQIENLQNPSEFELSGDKAIRNQFPYQVSLQWGNEEKYFWHVCSATILHYMWVTTTAFCVTATSGSYRVVAGLLIQNETSLDVQTVDVTNVIVHPDFEGGISKNDIALMKLSKTLIFTKAVQPISFITEENSEGVWGPAILSGWNIQNRESKRFPFHSLFYMILYIMTDTECKEALDKSIFQPEIMLCTEPVKYDNFCPGESGSPLVYDGYLVGITSWGTVACGITVYTKVASFADFIQTHIDFSNM